MSRRRLLGLGLGLGAAATLGLASAPAAAVPLPRVKPPFPRALSLYHLHTGESLTATYWADGGYVPESLVDINRFLRDFRTGEVVSIDARLLDLLWLIRGRMHTDRPFEVVSGYRSPATNARLARAGHEVAKRSYHLKGMAVDVNLPGHHLRHLWRAARRLRLGGVGYYPRSRFVHIDTGPVRFW